MKNSIRNSRYSLQNPYAYLDGNGEFSAASVDTFSDASHGQIAADRERLQNPTAHIDGEGEYSATTREKFVMPASTADLRVPKAQIELSRENVRKVAREIQLQRWRAARRHEQPIDYSSPEEIVSFLNPRYALEELGWSCSPKPHLGQLQADGNGPLRDVGATLDRSTRSIEYSESTPRVSQRFTLAHELGHVVMHTAVNMHRDLPLDGGDQADHKHNQVEREANWFAAEYLMPAKLLRNVFASRFGADNDPFIASDENIERLPEKYRSLLATRPTEKIVIARALATTTRFSNNGFNQSLAELFCVSPSCMAIRLVELNLIGLRT